MAARDTVFVSNAHDDSGDNSNDFYFYNRKNKQKYFLTDLKWLILLWEKQLL
jgi:hypothetical protein